MLQISTMMNISGGVTSLFKEGEHCAKEHKAVSCSSVVPGHY